MLVIWKNKKYIIIATIIIMILGGIYSFNNIKPKYRSYTNLIVGETDFHTYNRIIKSTSLLNEVKSRLKIDINEKNIKVNKISKTDVIQISVIDENSQLASKISNEIVKVFSEKANEIYNINNIHIIDLAVPSEKPYNINHIRDILIFAILGLALSSAYILINSKLDTKIKKVSDIETTIGLKTLVSIPNAKLKKYKNKIESFEDSEKNIIKDAFDNLKSNIQFSSIKNKENKSILITSCFSSEGRSYVTANLAVTFAKAGKKVVLIDADMRKNAQSKIFNIPNNTGFSNYLSNLDKDGNEINENINKVINETEIKNLNLVTSGSNTLNSSEIISSDRLPLLIKELNKFYDVVLFDGPPVLPLADSLILSRLVNSIIIVSLYKRTKKEELKKAKRDIQNVGGKIIGVVLNGAHKEKVKRKFTLKNLKRDIAERRKNKKANKKPKLLSEGSDGFREELKNIKINMSEKKKMKEYEKVKKAEATENRKISEAEEKTKLIRIREEEKIRRQQIKELDQEKKEFEKGEKKRKKELERNKVKEEARIKEELSEDNLYPKTKYTKNLF